MSTIAKYLQNVSTGTLILKESSHGNFFYNQCINVGGVMCWRTFSLFFRHFELKYYLVIAIFAPSYSRWSKATSSSPYTSIKRSRFSHDHVNTVKNIMWVFFGFWVQANFMLNKTSKTRFYRWEQANQWAIMLNKTSKLGFIKYQPLG